MIVRFGYVAMSMLLEDASPSKTMTYASFAKIEDREAAIRRLEHIAGQNLHNTLRLLKHSVGEQIAMYRFSSKLIPLATHPALEDWDPYPVLLDHFRAIGEYVQAHRMRVSLHPDHFCVLSTPRPEVLINSIKDLEYHVRMLEAMGLDERTKCNIHMGGAYGNKEEASARFVKQFNALPDRIKHRITLENDDKTFDVRETLVAAEVVGVPMVLDIHHYAVNSGGITETELVEQFWPRIQATWSKEADRLALDGAAALPPKIHASSPKSATDPRGHADYVDSGPLLSFLQAIAPSTDYIDCMLEAKAKDKAVICLMDQLKETAEQYEHLSILNDGSIKM